MQISHYYSRLDLFSLVFFGVFRIPHHRVSDGRLLFSPKRTDSAACPSGKQRKIAGQRSSRIINQHYLITGIPVGPNCNRRVTKNQHRTAANPGHLI
ncbi:hypothetical protein [Burkholderia pyrrocinia]|uniref:hypothetical protein n=1 Tax=Burkholderia pyrrocinia TaxID=60550 RepID=UPI00158B56B3|nr:hypothetical protein [Burkholderia pyrrocinia]